MQGILRGSLVTSCCSVIGDFSADAKTKLRRIINEEGPEFCQQHDWAFLHTTTTFNITDGTYSYVGSSYLPRTFQRFLATKIKDSNDNYSPIKEKSLSWYETIEDPSYEGTPYAVVLRGLDSNGYPRTNFYYCPGDTYTFEADCLLKWTDVDETSSGDSTRVVVTQDCITAFKYWIGRAYAIIQGDGNLVALCEKRLYGSRAERIPGALDALLSKQRGARKKRSIKPDGSYKFENILQAKDYGSKVVDY